MKDADETQAVGGVGQPSLLRQPLTNAIGVDVNSTDDSDSDSGYELEENFDEDSGSNVTADVVVDVSAGAETDTEEGAGEEAGGGGLLRINDLEHYIRSRGIEGSSGENNRQDREILARESAVRTDESARYQEEVIRRIFERDDHVSPQGSAATRGIIGGDECWEDMTLSIRAADGTEIEASLQKLAERCEFVQGMARFTSTSASSLEDEEDLRSDNPARKRPRKPLILSLEQFDAAAVGDFIPAALGERNVEDIEPEYLVEACRIAHYLRCPSVLDAAVPMLIQSVDTVNCMSLCHLADALDLPSLYEHAVNHMLTSLDQIEAHDLWDDLPKSLQVRVLSMQNAVRSSLLARGAKTGIFFSCGEEFLAILSDNLREQKERLNESRRRQREVILERLGRCSNADNYELIDAGGGEVE